VTSNPISQTTNTQLRQDIRPENNSKKKKGRHFLLFEKHLLNMMQNVRLFHSCWYCRENKVGENINVKEVGPKA